MARENKKRANPVLLWCLLSLTAAALATAAVSDATLAVMAEACHLVVDAARHTAAAQPTLAALYKRVAGDCDDLLAFGPNRLSLLVRFGAIFCAVGVAFAILLDALLVVLLPAHSHEHGSEVDGASVTVPWVAAVISALAAALAMADGGDSGGHHSAVRVSTLLMASSLGAISSLASSEAPRLPAAPPLLRVAVDAALRAPDATAGLVLTALAIARGCAEAAVPARLLLQAAPHELIPDLESRLARARAAPGVIDVRDVQLWALDESSALGSLVVVVRADANVLVAQRHVRRAFEGAPLSLTVQVDRDDDGEDDEAGFSRI